MPIEKPQNYDEMIEVVEKLANNFTQIRIDLYNVCGKLYFGEMTFTPASGFHQFTSYEADKALGKLWNLKMI